MNYIVPEDRLIELLTAELNLTALERGGVDNWSWYDGTTLNKYSEALASVGVNIKDASGEMK